MKTIKLTFLVGLAMAVMSCDPAGMTAALSVLQNSQQKPSTPTQSYKPSNSGAYGGSSGNSTSPANTSYPAPSIGYDETLVKNQKGVSVSYKWESAGSARNSSGEMVYAWRITAYVRNNASTNKSMGVVSIQPPVSSAALLPSGWYSSGRSFTMIDNGKMSGGDVQSESLTIYTLSPNKPGAPIVVLNVWN